jgi:hypothetical protein
VTSYHARRILPVVKTYPNPSQKYGETVCVAGVDLDTREWIRVYPLTFRQLPNTQFKKYQVIECRVTKPKDDSRPESVRVDQDSIKLVGRPISTADGWRRRMALLPEPKASLCEIKRMNEAHGVSIGMFRPKTIKRLVIEPAEPWTEKQRSALRQEHFGLGAGQTKHVAVLEQVPWTFSYKFECDEAACNGHKSQILDWEIAESFRRWSRSDPDRWEDMIRAKYERELPGKDIHLVVGTMAAHPKTFVIIGLVYPPRPQVDGVHVQQTLDLMGEQRTVAGVGVGLETQEAGPLGGDEGQDALELFPDEA